MDNKKKNWTGQRFGMLVVIKEVKHTNFCAGRPNRRWKVQCDCGTVKEVNQMHLTRKSGGVKSCGCVGKTKKHKTKSVKHYRRLYHIWFSMMSRCFKQNNTDYHKYGARGIVVVNDWENFSTFYDDMIDTYKPGLTIERKDNNGNYCKENCIWIKNEDQAKNRRTTVWIKGMCAKDYCKKHGISYGTFQQRRKSGKSIEDCLKQCA